MKAIKMDKIDIGKTTDRGADAMTMLEKIEAVKKVQDYMIDIKNKLEDIIKDTYDYYCDIVNDFNIRGKFIEVDYEYSCRGESSSDCVKIPVAWLSEGFDYKAAYANELRKAELRRKREEAAEKKRKEAAKKAAAVEKEKKEHELYLKLKAKYENNDGQN